MAVRTGLAVGLATLVSLVASAADPPWYVRKATWQDTLAASREVLDTRGKQATATVPLPDFGRDDFTVMAWVRTTVGGTILAKAPATGKWVPQAKTLFVGRGQLCYDIGWVGCVQSRRKIADGKWHHVAMTRGKQAIRLYIDGQADAAGTLSSGPDVSGHAVKIGTTCADFPRSGSGFRGELDELRVYTHVLSPDEIRAHAEKLQPARATGLVGYWPFDAGLADASGSGNHATVASKLDTTDGRFGKALKLDGSAHAVVRSGDHGSAFDAIWPLLQRDFPKAVTTLFDGKSLAGWQRRNQPGHGWGAVWTVADGAIDGVQEWPGALGMLATQRAFGDFELRLEVKTDWPIDTAVLLRESGWARAYQVTVHCRPDGDVGGIATHREGDPPVAAKGWKKVWKKDGWNRLRIVIKGNPPELRTWLNGTPTAAYTDPGKGDPLPPRGRIALKIHGSDDCFNNHATFRNIRMLRLD